MAEVRIPTDCIPPDILQYLQAIGQSIMSPVSGRTVPSSSPPPSSTSSTQSESFASSTSSPSSKDNSATTNNQTTLTLASSSQLLPIPSSMVSSLSRNTSKYVQSSSVVAASTTASAVTAVLPSPMASRDEIDGGFNGSIVHAIHHTKTRNSIPDVLDDSGIVRIFPMDEDENQENQSQSVKTESEIVNIFPKRISSDVVSNQSSIVPVVRSPSKHNISPSPKCVHVFENWHNSARSSTAQNIPPSNDNFHQSYVSTTPPMQLQDPHSLAPSPSRLGSAQLTPPHQGEFSGTIIDHETVSHRKVTPQRSTRQPSPRLWESARGDPERHPGKHRQFPALSVTARRSPVLPTPPQTPDDADAEDDEVFTYDNIPNCDDAVSKRRALDTYRQSTESTPRRDHLHLRHNSDRSSELRHSATHGSSTFSPSQKLSELTFGDRRHTRKRLSFEEDDVNHPMSPRPVYSTETLFTNTSASLSFLPPQSVPPTISTASSSLANHKYRSAPISTASPAQIFQLQSGQIHQNISPVHFRPAVSDSSPHTYSLTQSTASQLQAPPPSPYRPMSCQSPVTDVMNMLEKVSREQVPGTSRSRLHSDGDEVTNEHWTHADTRVPIADQLRPRRQTISYGKRRRLDHPESRDCDTVPANHTELTPSRDHLDQTAEGLCLCAKIKRSVLQMAECAYKQIRRMDATPADFGRFRQELAQTNETLLASLNVINNFRSICEHHNDRTPSPSSPSSSSSSSLTSASTAQR